MSETTYKRLVLLRLLHDLYPSVPIACGSTYTSIILYNTTEPVVPEETIINSYPTYLQKYNLSILRRERQQRLMATDFCGLADYPFPDDETKQSWLSYRQALRNITTTYPNPEVDDNDNLIDIIWPTLPTN